MITMLALFSPEKLLSYVKSMLLKQFFFEVDFFIECLLGSIEFVTVSWCEI